MVLTWVATQIAGILSYAYLYWSYYTNHAVAPQCDNIMYAKCSSMVDPN